MADLFSVTVPLLVRYPDGVQRVMAEVFPHPEGLLYFELFWDQAAADNAVHLVEGEIHGAGPWKAGECVITLLGCHGSHPEQAAEYAAWQLHLEELGERYPTQRQIEKMAREHGVLVWRRNPFRPFACSLLHGRSG